MQHDDDLNEPENPYAAPPSSSDEPAAVPQKVLLRDLARTHRRVIFGLLSFFVFIVTNAVVGVALRANPNKVLGLLDELLLWVSLGILLFNGVMIYKLVSMIRPEQVIGLLYLFLLVVLPPVGLFMLWRVCRSATEILRSHGIQVGLLGADPTKI